MKVDDYSSPGKAECWKPFLLPEELYASIVFWFPRELFLGTML